MEYKHCGNTVVLRVDRGEEIVSTVKEVCIKERISCAEVSGIGAVDRAVVGLYRVAEKKYCSNTFEGEREMTSLLGNITRKDGETYLHFHASFAGADGHSVGGHLSEAVVSGTAEIFIRILPVAVGRVHDSATGLNLFKF